MTRPPGAWRRRWICGAALVATVLSASPALAQDDEPLRLTATDTLLTQFRADNKNDRDEDDNYGIFINRLNLTGVSGNLTTQLRLDTTYFPDETLGFPNPPDARFQDDARLERLTVKYQLDGWTLVAGDFYEILGRGIALSLRKVDEAGLDVVLRGGEVTWKGEDLKVMAFAGRTNPVNIDTVNQLFIKDTDDILTGGQAEYRFRYGDGQRATLGLYGLFLQPDEPLLPGERDQTFADGLFIDMPGLASWLSLYAEVGTQRRELAGEIATGVGVGETILANGYAGYTTVDMAFGDMTLLLEGLFLDDYEVRGGFNTSLGSRFDYNFAPTLERFDQEVFDNRDVRGGRARVEYTFIPEPDEDDPDAEPLDIELVLFANAMVRLNRAGDPEELRQFHAYSGFEVFYQEGASRLLLSGGYRDEAQKGGGLKKSMPHVEGDWVQRLNGEFSLHVTGNVEFRTLDEVDFLRGSTFLGMERVVRLDGGKAERMGLTFEFGYDTQDPNPQVRNLFFAGIASWEPRQDLTLRATVGTQRGGIKCIAGICREFPAFSGGQLELVSRF